MGKELVLRNATVMQRGFSLIELLIVVAIILIIAAIAIPNLLQARMAANESSAVSSLRQIKTAELAYSNSFTSIGYAPALINLGCAGPCPNPPTPGQAALLDDVLAMAAPGSPGKSGYVFAATGISAGGPLNSDFVAAAAPINASRSGNRDFCAVADATLRFRPSTAGGVPVTTLGACQAFPNIVN
jgi:prepilin-type N-terminal cleavage/methylation domain-containing protein